MAVDNPGVIDAIGADRTTGEVVLTIADHLEWDDGNEHLLVLQEKINRYLGFIEAGELLANYPSAQGKPVRIDVVCKYPPSEAGERALTLASGIIERAGWSLTWRWWPKSEADPKPAAQGPGQRPTAGEAGHSG
jgi:hypothetical protein